MVFVCVEVQSLFYSCSTLPRIHTAVHLSAILPIYSFASLLIHLTVWGSMHGLFVYVHVHIALQCKAMHAFCVHRHAMKAWACLFMSADTVQGNAWAAAGPEEAGTAAGPSHARFHGSQVLPELLLLLPLAAHPLQARVCL